MKKIEEETLYGNNIVYLQYLNKKEFEMLEDIKVSSVHCFPIKEDEILFTVNPRGIDIIGGHVEKGETVEQALLREAKEEACIIPINYEIIGAIQVDNRDNPNALEKCYPMKGYQLFYKVTQYETLDFKADHECTDRKYVSISDISNTHHKWLNVHDKLLTEIDKKSKKYKM